MKADDPAFGQPTKFVGPVYDEARARELAAKHGWEIHRDGVSWRRVAPSPEPAALVELDMIEAYCVHHAHGPVTVIRPAARQHDQPH